MVFVLLFLVCSPTSVMAADFLYFGEFSLSLAHISNFVQEKSVPGEGIVYIYEGSFSKQHVNSSYHHTKSTHNANIMHIEREMVGSMNQNSQETMLLDIRRCHTLWLIVLSKIFWRHMWRTRYLPFSIIKIVSMEMSAFCGFYWNGLPMLYFIYAVGYTACGINKHFNQYDW